MLSVNASKLDYLKTEEIGSLQENNPTAAHNVKMVKR